MAQNESNSTSGGIGFFGAIFLIFLTLKLIGIITWSWWWVTAPLWGPLAVVAGGFVIYVIYLIFKHRGQK